MTSAAPRPMAVPNGGSPQSSDKRARKAAASKKRRLLPSPIRQYNIRLNGRQTSISLEPEFWRELARMAKAKGFSTNWLIASIDRKRQSENLSSACRIAVLNDVLATAETRLANIMRADGEIDDCPLVYDDAETEGVV